MAKTEKRAKGDMGEGVACKYLESKGFLVVERNYLKPLGEIDVIAKKGKKLHFVEVKTVSHKTGEGIRPEENVHEAKLRRLERAIQTYLLSRKVGEEVEWQVDLACVYLDFSTRKAKVEMLENIL